MSEVLTAEALASLEAKMCDYYLSIANYRTRIAEQAHTRAGLEHEVRQVCLACDECRCWLDGDPSEDATCPRFEAHFETLKAFASYLGLRIDPAADGELDSFIEFSA